MKLLPLVKKDDNLIVKTLESLKNSLIHCLIFSIFINILSLALPIYSMQVLDRVLGSSSIETLFFLSIIVFFAIITMNAITSVRDAAFNFIARSFEKELSLITFSKNIKDSFAKPISSLYIKDLNVLKNFIASQNLKIIFDFPWVFIFLAVIFYIHWIPGLLILTATILFSFFAYLNYAILKNDSEKFNELNIKANQKLELITRNSEIALAMGMVGNLALQYNKDQEDLKEIEKRIKKKSRDISSFVKNVRFTLQILISFVSAILIINGKMSAGGMIAVSILAGKVLTPFDASSSVFQAVLSVKKSYLRLKKAITIKQEERIDLPAPNGNVKFDGVSLISPENQIIIKNISFEARAGEIIGIIGKSGSGKTTIARLITGAYRATKGKVMIDEAPIEFWNQEKIGSHIGYLPQDIELFYTSIKQNIAKMSLEINDELVIKAAKIAQSHELILSLEQGYETEVGNVNISAGQKQRIALARCFYGDTKIMVLDEPNSNLDIDGENALFKSLENAKKEKITVFIISHKPSLLESCDRIMVINEGELKMFDDKKKIIENFSKR